MILKIEFPLDLGSTHLIFFGGKRGGGAFDPDWGFFQGNIGPAYYLSAQRLFSIIFNLIFYGR